MTYLSEVRVLLATLPAIPRADHTLVYLIVAAFLAITLLIGLRAGRGIKTLREYAVANKTYGTVALVLTYLATEIGGGSILGDVKEVFAHGIIMTATLSGLMITYLVRAMIFAPKMAYFQDAITMGDLMGELYGKLAGMITGMLSLCYALAVVGLQLTAMAIIFDSLLGINPSWGMLVTSLILAAYSAYGGIKAVVATDLLQFLVLIIIFPLIAFLILT